MNQVDIDATEAAPAPLHDPEADSDIVPEGGATGLWSYLDAACTVEMRAWCQAHRRGAMKQLQI